MEKLKFSEDAEILSLEQINNMQFAKLRIKVYSTALTAHGYFSTKAELKRASKSICNKPLLVYVNPFTDDFEGHEDDGLFKKEIPCGFVPCEESANIKFEKDEDGTIFLVCDAYIWTMYFDNVKTIFERDGGNKSVSVELLAIETEDKDDGTTELKEFSFTGITLLGEKVRPAVTNASAKLIQNSSSINAEYEKAKIEFEKILYNSVKQEPVETDSYFNTKNKEEKMEEKIIKDSTSPDVIENATQEVTNKVTVSTEVYSYDDNGDFVGTSYEQHVKETTEIKEVPENEVAEPNTNVINEDNTINNSVTEVENVCKTKDSTVDVEEFEALKSRCSTLEQELATKNAEYDALMQKCLSLEEYKNNKEKENMKNEIEVALNSVSHILNSAQIDEWRKESEKCSVDNVDEFTNKLKAFAFDVQEKNGVLNADPIRNSIPIESEKEPTDFWERMEKKYR